MLIWIGGITVLIYLIKIVACIYQLKKMKGFDLAERYGKGTWALITGSTGGIGEAFAN